MDKLEALECLANGHSMWTLEGAREVLKAFDLELPDGLITKWTGQADANPNNDPKGLWLDKDEAGEGVASYGLSNYVVNKLDLKVSNFYGRGTQARTNAEAIKKHFGL